MKILLLTFCLFTLFTDTLFAQYNQFRDDAAYRDKQRQYMAQHKIKQVDEYMLNGDDTTITNKAPQYSLFYDAKGRVVKCIYYFSRTPTTTVPDSPSVTYTYNPHGKPLGIETKAFYHQLKTYVYNTKGKPLKETYITTVPTDNTYGYHSYITTYRYNKSGHVIEQANFSPANVLYWKKHFVYNKHHTIIKCMTQKPGNGGVTCDKYRYSRNHQLLTKIVRSYKNDTLILARQYVYDKHHNQIKGYEIKDGVKKTVWNYSYNSKGQLVRSIGGPATDEGLSYDDFRKDGLVPITYTYSANGLLMELNKTNYFPNMGKEVKSTQRFVYKMY